MLRCCIVQLLAAAWLAFAPFAQAATETPAQPAALALQQAKQLMQDGQPARAYQLLESWEFEQAGDIDFDYLIGIAALDSGKADKATLALERVLARDPNLAGARLDMARAWYVLGDFERARQELQVLQAQNPPSGAAAMIKQLQTAIEHSEHDAKHGRRWGGYLEAGIGFDDNVTSVVNDFTDAAYQTYGLPGFMPTGSSVKRSSSFLTTQGGIDFSQRLSEKWIIELDLDAKWRGLPRSQAYSSQQLDWRAALQYKRDIYQVRLGLNLQQFWQETEQPNANRRSQGVFAQWLRYVGNYNQISLMLAANRQHYPDIPYNDGDNFGLSFGWRHQFAGKWKPSIHASLNLGKDQAKFILSNGASNDKESIGIRLFGQISPAENWDAFASYGYTHRRDRDYYARSTVVLFGNDRISDVTVGFTWRAKTDWSLQSQWNYSRNDSNVALNQYRRNEVSVSLRYDFQ